MKYLMSLLVFASAVIFYTGSVSAADPVYPDYIKKAQNAVDQADAKSAEWNRFKDEVLMARNYVNKSEAEYKNNIGWSGKLDTKAEPAVRYLAEMAELQASIVIARAAKLSQDKERTRLDGLLAEAKTRIKVFEDKDAEISGLKKAITDLNASVTSLNKEKEQLIENSNALNKNIDAKKADISIIQGNVIKLTSDLDACNKKVTSGEQKNAALASDLSKANGEITKLNGDISALNAQKGAVESQSKEQIDALNRVKQFNEAVGKLGGVMKATADGTTVIFARAPLFKIAGKTTVLSPEGEKTTARILELMKNFTEYRAVIKVHGFGTPTKSEDSTATDYMARLLRDDLVVKGKADSTSVEAMGAGTSAPLYAKGNPDVNRRVEVTFVKR